MPKKGKAKSKNGQPDKACTVCKASIKGHNGPYCSGKCQNTGTNTSMISNIDHCTQTASLHTTPYRSPIRWATQNTTSTAHGYYNTSRTAINSHAC